MDKVEKDFYKLFLHVCYYSMKYNINTTEENHPGTGSPRVGQPPYHITQSHLKGAQICNNVLFHLN